MKTPDAALLANNPGVADNGAMNIVALVVDRLHAGHLGCYGNSWIATPEIDRLSIESFLFDGHLAAGARLHDAYDGYWFGRHPAARRATTLPLSLPAALKEAELNSTLLTDDPAVLDLDGADDFDESLNIDPLDLPRAAAEIEETHLARFFAAAIDAIQSLEQTERPFVLWLHTRGLGGPWDAPRDFRTQYAEPGEADPPDFVDVPDLRLADDHDPDQLWGVVQAYAGQVALLDACLGVMLERLRSGSLDADTLLTVTSPRGFPLGEHRHVGPAHDALYGELLNTPWIMRFPRSESSLSVCAHCRPGQADRSQALTGPLDLYGTLLDCCGLPTGDLSMGSSMFPIIRGDQPPVGLRDRLCIFAADGEQAIRTPAWFMRVSEPSASSDAGVADGRSIELFAKPDDRFEFNNVADRCPAVVAGLLEVLDYSRKSLANDPTIALSPLPDELTFRKG